MTTLLIGNKNYSSWSLRPWLFLRKTGLRFDEQMIYLDAHDYQQQIAALSPSRRVPLLIDDNLKIWDSMAICEYAAEATGRGLPADRAARARARSVSAEMHAGFQALRNDYPMNVRARDRRPRQTPELLTDISRIDEIWSGCLQDHGGGGRWLFGEFSMADAMFAPVAFRFQSYGANLSEPSQAYLRHVLQDSDMQAWQDAALREGHPLPRVDNLPMG